jgi:hypothetical protein
MKYLKAYGIFFLLFAVIGYVVNIKSIKGSTADLTVGMVAGKYAEGAGWEIFLKKLVAVVVGYEIGKWAAESQETPHSPTPRHSVVNPVRSSPPPLSDEEMMRSLRRRLSLLPSPTSTRGNPFENEKIKQLLQPLGSSTPVQAKP